MSRLSSKRFLNRLNEINPVAIRFESEMMSKLALSAPQKTARYYAKKIKLTFFEINSHIYKH